MSFATPVNNDPKTESKGHHPNVADANDYATFFNYDTLLERDTFFDNDVDFFKTPSLFDEAAPQKEFSLLAKQAGPNPVPWRYIPPRSVVRPIIEIQGVVGSNPDGVYGPQTKSAVENYQMVLKSHGLYADTIDGKWGPNTDVAHEAFALTAPKRRGYNCAGFAFKRFVWLDLLPTKSILSGMTKLAGPSSTTPPNHHKFWFWDIRVSVRNTVSGVSSRINDDFHIVGGQTDARGDGPQQVMSKNGQRPVEGPRPPLAWELKSGQALDQDNNPIPNVNWVIHSSTLGVFSSRNLP